MYESVSEVYISFVEYNILLPCTIRGAQIMDTCVLYRLTKGEHIPVTDVMDLTNPSTPLELIPMVISG